MRYNRRTMNLLVTFGVAVALAMDCFAVSMGMACGATRLRMRQIVRMAAAFGFFQFGMPVVGWFAGERIVRLIGRFDHWLAFGLLAFIGGRMIYESFALSEEEKGGRPDRTRGAALLVLSVATSIDALAVGLSLGVIKSAILFPAAVIGGVCFLMTVVGAKLGPLLGRAAGKRAELLGGLILIGIGVKVLAGHL